MQDRNVGVSLATNYQHSPYVGPRPFTTQDRDIFFGRNQEAIELTSLIKAHPEVVLYAPSGAGKTSLLYAQVLPILETEDDFDVLPTARVRSQESAIIPEDKINNIYVFNVLKDLSNDRLSVIERAQLSLSDFLKREPRALSGEHRPDDKEPPERRLPRVVVFDQFEEIFTLYPQRYKDRQDFFSQVAAALAADPFLRVVFSMREDYIAELDPYVEILPQGLRTRFRLERLRRTNALACVKRPLETDRCKETRRHFADGAAESLVDKLLAIRVKAPSGERIEVPGEFVDPVQLQVVCQTLWEKLPPDELSISKEDIAEYANVDEALLDFYETSIHKAVIAANNGNQAALAGGANGPVPPPITEGLVRGWFEQKLITRENKRNMVNREQHTTAGLPNGVVDELENQHLIRVEMRGGEPWYELSHDRFIPPIRESNRRFLLQQPVAKRKAQELEQRAEEWWNAQRDPALLLNRGELADAQNWMRTEAAAIGYSNTLYSLVQASEAAIQHEENLQQQALADALQQKAALERQRSRNLKMGLAAASLLLLFTVGSTVFALNRWSKASTAQKTAWDFYEKAQAESKRARDAADQLLQVNKDLKAQTKAAEDARKDTEKALGLANKERTAANVARQQAESAASEATRQKAEAVRQRAEAVRQKASADSARSYAEKTASEAKSAKYAGDAKYQLTLKNPELALRLAMMAVKEADTGNAQTSLRQAYQAFAAQRILKGHEAMIRKAIYSLDGRFIFTASEDLTVRQWDATTDQLVRKLEGHTGGVHDIAVSPDGSRVATEASDSSGRIWNLADGSFIPLKDLSGPVAAIAFSPDGRLLATEASDSEEQPGFVPRLWDVRTGRIVQRLIGHSGAVSALAFSPDGKLLVSASWDHTARLWDVATGKQLWVMSGHTAPLASVAFSPNGKLVVTGSYDSTARIWDIEGQKELVVLRGHTGEVQSVTFSPNGQFVLTSGKKVRSTVVSTSEVPLPETMLRDDDAPDDNSVRLFDLTGRQIRQFAGHTGDISSASFSSDGRLVVTASEDGTAKVWRADSGERILDVKPPGGAGQNYAVLSPDNTFLLVAGANRTAEVWRVDPLQTTARFVTQRGSVGTITFADEGTLLTSSTAGVRLWDATTGSLRRGFDLPVAEVAYSTAVNPNGTLMVTGSQMRKPSDRSARLWQNGTAQVLATHETPVTRVLFSPQGNYIVTLSGDSVKIWRTADRGLVKSFAEDPDAQGLGLRAAAVSKDERYIAIGDRGGIVRVFEVVSGAPVIRIQEHAGAINSVAFNGDAENPLIVTAGADGTARVYASTSGKPQFTLRDHTGPVTYASFSPDNRLIVTIGVDRTARIWDAQRGTLVATFAGYTQTPASAALSADGTQLAVGSTAGTVFVSNCKVCRPIDQVLKLSEDLKPRQLTPEEEREFIVF